MITFHIITLFPESFAYLNQSILKRAEEKKKIKIQVYNLRNFSKNKHHKVDEKPYGGGAGMVLMAEPIVRAVDTIRSKVKGQKLKVVLLSAKGKQFTQKIAHHYAKHHNHIIFIAGRYEGIDERVKIILKAEEMSIGPYVLTDGEVASMVLISAIARLVPGVIRLESLEEESHFHSLLKKEADGGILEYPHYTRPEVLEYKKKKFRVPEVLLSGNHKKIEEWRLRRRK